MSGTVVRALAPSQTTERQPTHRHLGKIRILVRSNPYCGLNRPRDIPLLGIRLQQLRPWLLRIPRRIETPLIRFLGFFLVVQAQREVAQNLPFQARLAVRDVLRFEMGYFGTVDSPDAQILQRGESQVGAKGGSERTS